MDMCTIMFLELISFFDIISDGSTFSSSTGTEITFL